MPHVLHEIQGKDRYHKFSVHKNENLLLRHTGGDQQAIPVDDCADGDTHNNLREEKASTWEERRGERNSVVSRALIDPVLCLVLLERQLRLVRTGESRATRECNRATRWDPCSSPSASMELSQKGRALAEANNRPVDMARLPRIEQRNKLQVDMPLGGGAGPGDIFDVALILLVRRTMQEHFNDVV